MRRTNTLVYMVAISWPLTTCHVRSFVFQQKLSTRRAIHNFRNNKFPSVNYYPFCTQQIAASTDDTSSATLSTAAAAAAAALLSEDDRRFLSQALDYARFGEGHTFPNPAVGCILVQQGTQEVLGAGFHPRAGYPHAEIFALLEAAGHVESGVASAKGVVGNTPSKEVQELAHKYTTEHGPEALFGDVFADQSVTAYVTLEPCCHYGKTPPCASSLELAKVDRVVVGCRDPNPRVDGGGMKLLQDAGIEVTIADSNDAVAKDFARLIDNFVKRIIPKDYDAENYSHVSGAMRRTLRSIAGRSKKEGSLVQVNWTGKVKAALEEEVAELELPAEWMEHLDGQLWKKELVNLRLNKAVNKKKLAKQLGERVAGALGAHVAQSVGHTVLLYRPGIPPVLDLDKLTEEDEANEDGESSR